MKLNEASEDEYYEDYYDEEDTSEEQVGTHEDYYEADYEDYYKEDTEEAQDRVTPEPQDPSSTKKDYDDMNQTPPPLVSDDEDLTESSGLENDEDYHSISHPSVQGTTATTTATTTTTTTTTSTTPTTTTQTSTTASGEYYFDEEEDAYSGDTLYDPKKDFMNYNISQESIPIEDKIPEKVTEDSFIDSIEGSGTSTIEEQDSTQKLSYDISDDEDLAEGSGYDYVDNSEVIIEEEKLVDLERESPKKDLSEAETRRRSEFFELHGLDLLSLDMSCMQNFVSGDIHSH